MEKIAFKDIRVGDYIRNYDKNDTSFRNVYFQVDGITQSGNVLISNLFVVYNTRKDCNLIREEKESGLGNTGIFYKLTEKEYNDKVGKDIILLSL